VRRRIVVIALLAAAVIVAGWLAAREVSRRYVYPELYYQDPTLANAQRCADFRIYLPTWLPQGCSLSHTRWNPFQEDPDGSWSPNSISVAIEGRDHAFLLEEHTPGEDPHRFPESDLWVVGGTLAHWNKHAALGFPELTFARGTTEISLRGRFTQDEFVAMAKSMRLATPGIGPARHERTSEDEWPAWKRTSGRNAQRAADFVLYAPTRLPAGVEYFATFQQPIVRRGGWATPARATIAYKRGRDAIILEENRSSQEYIADRFDWAGEYEVEVRPGQPAWWLPAEEHRFFPRSTLCWRQGETLFSLLGPPGMSFEQMREMAASVQPVAPNVKPRRLDIPFSSATRKSPASFQDAIRAVDFVVLRPRSLPEGWKLAGTALVQTETKRGPRKPAETRCSFELTYVKGAQWLILREGKMVHPPFGKSLYQPLDQAKVFRPAAHGCWFEFYTGTTSVSLRHTGSLSDEEIRRVAASLAAVR